MAHTISVLNDSSIINIRFAGAVDLNERMSSIKELCVLLSSTPSSRFLVNVRECTNLMTLREQEYLGRYIAEKNEFSNTKTAVISNDLCHSSDTIINSAAYNAGYCLAPFVSESEAIDWLNEEPRS